MSGLDNQDCEMGNVTNDQLHQSSQEESHFNDSSFPLFKMYSKIAEEEDDKMVERWQKDAEGIIIFSGLFSAVVATLVAVSVQDLRPNSQDTSAFYLEKMYQLQADPSASRPSVPSTADKPPAFSPPRYSIWVNSLWFLSLVISLTCAMLATLLQQWARRYIRNAQRPRRSLEKRARMHAFFANGVDKFHVSWVVEALPALVHLSLFIFFAGLLVFLFNIDRTIFSAVVCWVALSSAVYACITLMPIIWHDSPCFAPLSSPAWSLYTALTCAIFKLLGFIASKCMSYVSYVQYMILKDRYRGWFFGGLEKAAEEISSEWSPELDSRIVGWVVEALSEDEELERLFESIPGFCTSDTVYHLQAQLPVGVWTKTSREFLRRTLLSGSVSESVARRRLAACLNATGVVGGPFQVAEVLQKVLLLDWDTVPHAVEIGHFLGQWANDNGGMVTLEVRGIIAYIVWSGLKSDDRWKALTLDHLNVLERVLEDYLAHGDSVQLASLINLLDVLICHLPRSDWSPNCALEAISNFDIQNTLPELQHHFCVLWNKFVEEARDSGTYSLQVRALGAIRKVYIALHRDTDAAPTAFSGSTGSFSEVLMKPSSYPSCNLPGHLSKPDPSAKGETPNADAAAPLTTPRRDPVPAMVTPTLPGLPLLPTSDIGHTTSQPGEGSSLGEVLSPVVPSSKRASLVPLASSPGSDIAVATQVTDEPPTILSTSNLPLRSYPVAPTCDSQPMFTPLSDSTVSPQLTQTTTLSPLPPRLACQLPSSPLLTSPTRHTPSEGLQPLTARSSPQPDQT